MKIDLSECVENLVNMADYLLALKGKKAQCNTYDSVDSLSSNELKNFSNVLCELEINLEGSLFNVINTLLSLHGLENSEDNEELDYSELYKLILDKGEFGYAELLNICKMEHLVFCNIEK